MKKILLIISFGFITNTFSSSIHDIVLTAAKNSQVLKKSSAETSKAALGVREVVSEFLPKVDVFAFVNRERSSSRLAHGSSEYEIEALTPTGYGAKLNLNLFNGFRSKNSFHAKKISLTAAEKRLLDKNNSVIYQAITDTYKLAASRQVLAQSEQNIVDAKKTLYMLHLKRKSGLSARSDEALVKGRLRLLELAHKKSANDLVFAEANFVRDVGIIPPKNIEFSKIPYDLLPKTFSEFKTIVLRNDPSLAALRQDLQSYRYKKSMQMASFLPKLDLSLVAERDNQRSNPEKKINNFEVTLNANWNLFDGGKSTASKENVLVQQQELLSDLQMKIDDRINESKKAWDTYNQSRSELNALTNYVNDLKISFYDYQEQFSIGRRSVINLLDMQLEYLRSEVDLKQNQYQVQLAAYKLFYLMNQISSIA